MKKVIALMFILLICLGAFAGCGEGQNDSADNNSTSSTSETAFSTEDVIYLDGDNESVYQIVSANGSSKLLTSYLYKQMKGKLNTNIKNVTDEQDGSGVFEILVGETNRPETAFAKQYLAKTVGGRYKDYIICTVGKKIVIYSRDEDSISDACKYFAENYLKAEGVKGGIMYTFASQGDYIDPKINGTKLGMFSFVKQRFSESYITQLAIEESNELLFEKTGYLIEVVEDHNTASEYEIIIGNANREGVTAITDKDLYSITISGKKVYLNGGSPQARAMAVYEFAKMITAGDIVDGNSISNLSYSQAAASYDSSKYYSLSWGDDFDAPVEGHATGIDLTKWEFGTDVAEGHNGRTSVRSQDPTQLYVKDGVLHFYSSYDDNYYYGFQLHSRYKMRFKYGILEMNAILPDGGGMWTALWAVSHDSENPAAFKTEVNVCEMFGNSAVEASNMHGWLKDHRKDYYNSKWAPEGVGEHFSLDVEEYHNQKRYNCPDGKFNNGFHTFTYIWDENTCAFACDGNKYFEINLNEKEVWKETFSQYLYVVVSQATGYASQQSCAADNDPAWQESNNFLIDYVHVYQKNDEVHLIKEGTLSH